MSHKVKLQIMINDEKEKYWAPGVLLSLRVRVKEGLSENEMFNDP